MKGFNVQMKEQKQFKLYNVLENIYYSLLTPFEVAENSIRGACASTRIPETAPVAPLLELLQLFHLLLFPTFFFCL
jgi:hypothetical protein